MVLELTQQNFEAEVLRSKVPVVVDFWAEWCGPCRALAPIFEKLSKEFDGKIKFAKLNVENEGILAGEFSIRGIPTQIIFYNGNETERIVGLLPESEIRRKLDKFLITIS